MIQSLYHLLETETRFLRLNCMLIRMYYVAQSSLIYAEYNRLVLETSFFSQPKFSLPFL